MAVITIAAYLYLEYHTTAAGGEVIIVATERPRTQRKTHAAEQPRPARHPVLVPCGSTGGARPRVGELKANASDALLAAGVTHVAPLGSYMCYTKNGWGAL